MRAVCGFATWYLRRRQFFRAIDSAAAAIAFLPALWCGLFEAVSIPLEEPMWTNGVTGMSTSRLSKLKHHLAIGGQMCLGATSTEFNTSLVVKMGDGMHGRTAKEGCELPIDPTGEGGEELVGLARLTKRVFFAMTM